jgi:hypothetical protein
MELFLFYHFLTKRNGKQETHGRRGWSRSIDPLSSTIDTLPLGRVIFPGMHLPALSFSGGNGLTLPSSASSG